MNIREMAIRDLIPYENNPRNNDDAVEYVVNSIKEFGFKVPIIIDRNNVIVAGHTRLKAAEELGMNTVPCIVADDLSEEQVKAFRLADNKVGEFAGWNFEALEEELQKLSDYDMSNFGFHDFSFDIDSFYIDEDEPQDEKENGKPTRIQCPHCGEWFEPEL